MQAIASARQQGEQFVRLNKHKYFALMRILLLVYTLLKKIYVSSGIILEDAHAHSISFVQRSLALVFLEHSFRREIKS